MVKKMQLGTKTLHCFSECPDIAGVELQTVINSALRQLNKLIDNTYSAYKAKFPMVTRPNLYVYIVENKIDEINAFTDGQDIYIAAACMIGMHSYIKERLNTKKVNGGTVVPKVWRFRLKHGSTNIFLNSSLPMSLRIFGMATVCGQKILCVPRLMCHTLRILLFSRRRFLLANLKSTKQ